MKRMIPALLWLAAVLLNAADYNIVTDRNGGLEWLDRPAGEDTIWRLARAGCAGAGADGGGWRLPSKKELVRLAASAALKQRFGHLRETVYWSGEEAGRHGLDVWTVYLGSGFASRSDKCDRFAAVCVRRR